MADVNKVILIGRITADPELKTTQSGTFFTRFSLAVNRRFAKQGEEKQVDFIYIGCWQKNAEFVCKYFKKGSSIFISGSLQVSNWKDKDGNNRTTTEVIADEVQFVESKKDSANSQNNDYSKPSFSNTPSGDFQEIGDDDELPF